MLIPCALYVHRLASTNFGDLWMPVVVFVLLLASLCEGLKKLITSQNPENTLMISLVWVVYNMIPPFLLMWYTFVGQKGTLRVRTAEHLCHADTPTLFGFDDSCCHPTMQHCLLLNALCAVRLHTSSYVSTPLQMVCKACFWLSTLLAIGALVLIWCFFPSAYDYGRALGDSHFFFKTQRVGRLPTNNDVSWRADALLQEEAIRISTSTSAYDLSGGYMTVRECMQGWTRCLASFLQFNCQVIPCSVVTG